MKVSRVFLPSTHHLADRNALICHPAERGSWVWHPNKPPTGTAVLRFRLRFFLNEAAAPLIHVTGDQRFQLRCDGEDVSFGPDRGDLEHWTTHSLKLELSAGEHEFVALAWFIGDANDVSRRVDPAAANISPPMAQVTWRGGFLLYAEIGEVAVPFLNTGEAPWTVEDLSEAVDMKRPELPFYHDVGPTFAFDLERWAIREGMPVAVVMPPLIPNNVGGRRPGWSLHSTMLPEQRRERWKGGKIRFFRPSWDDSCCRAEEGRNPEISQWQSLLDRDMPLTIPANMEVTVIWDLEDYYCGYPLTRVEGGKDAVIAWSWAEALYQEASPKEVNYKSSKGHRGEIEGKVFLGLEDRWTLGSEEKTETPSLWWRCGRYVRLRVKTSATPLTLCHLGLITTGYPLDFLGAWQSSDPSWDHLMPIFHRSYQIAAHETWTDTPYYEQLCYVGDNLLNSLSNYAWCGDARLSRRSVELFEWSRRASGFVAERYPSSWRQESATFSLLWPMMVRDLAWWRDDPAFIKSMLPGLRSVMAEFDGLALEDGLLHHVPGWPFVDWVPGWEAGCGPGAREGDSSMINLLWVLSLLATAQVEEAFGDLSLSQRCRKIARHVFDQILLGYWNEKRGILMDTRGSCSTSEHAQTFALLTGLLDPLKTESCLAALRLGEGLSKATISASFYVLDALYRHGDSFEFHRRLRFWRGLPESGFTTTPEGPEPTRSDSHPWGAHPAWHTLASIAGVRPDAPGFAKVKIAPLPGPISSFDASVVHPSGLIEVAFRRQSEALTAFNIILPKGVTGTLVFGDKSRELVPGKNELIS